MKNLKYKIEKLGLSYKKEATKIVVIIFALIVVGIAGTLVLKNSLFLVFSGGFAVIFTIFYVNRYDAILNRINEKNLLEFSNLFSFFRIYIKNGYNVYNALKEISKFANKDLECMLRQLLEDIDIDKSVQPFISFSKNFNEIIIEELMLSVYQMVDEGEQSNYLTQFSYIFDKFSDLLVKRELEKKKSRLGTLSSAPLLASGFLIIVITIGIILILGDFTNGI